jgi:hypothetical protein
MTPLLRGAGSTARPEHRVCGKSLTTIRAEISIDEAGKSSLRQLLRVRSCFVKKSLEGEETNRRGLC